MVGLIRSKYLGTSVCFEMADREAFHRHEKSLLPHILFYVITPSSVLLFNIAGHKKVLQLAWFTSRIFDRCTW